MAEKGKTLKVDVEKKTVLVKTNISDTKEWGKDVNADVFVEFDFSEESDQDILNWAANDLRIAVRRAHLIPMGVEGCKATSKEKPFKVKASEAGNSGRKRGGVKLEEMSVEQLEAEIERRKKILAVKKAEAK